jgi:hypothetical protein
MTKLPQNGGDTLWASGYDLYDRYSKPYQKFLEGLTATNASDGYVSAAKADPERVQLFEGPSGAPDNIGGHLTAVYPVVRTNPVTGWKSVFSVGPFSKRINELSIPESDRLLKEFTDMVAMSPEMQVRHKWRNENDMGMFRAFSSVPYRVFLTILETAIWDNRSAFHIGLLDYEGLGERFGYRIVSIGEKPYQDPNSVSRAVALGLEDPDWRLEG